MEAIREGYHAEKGLPIVETLIQDCNTHFGCLRKSPVFTLVAVLTLALGIGANAAIFTLVNALMLKSLPVTDPKTLIWLGNKNDCCVGFGFSDNGEYSYLRRTATNFCGRMCRSLKNWRRCRRVLCTGPSWFGGMTRKTRHDR